MDPISLFQVVGTVVSISDVIFKCIKRLSMLKAKYHDAPMLISTLIGQLYIVQAALDQLQALTSQDLVANGCDQAEITAKGKLTFLWNESEMINYSNLLDRQVNAESSITSDAMQRDMIHHEDNQSILKLAKDISSSRVGQNSASSYISKDTAAISTLFDFDTILLSSTQYQQAQKSHLRQAIRATRDQKTELPLTKASSIERALAVDNDGKLGNKTPTSSKITDDNSKPRLSPAQPSKRATDVTEQQQSTIRRTSQSKTSFIANWRKDRQYTINDTAHGEHEGPKPGSSGSSKSTLQKALGKANHNVLILGTAQSGKTTMLKTFKLLLEGGYTEDEKLVFREIIWMNTL
ncbi:hypothetical protein F4677DRAFT_451234 [Hypoxylon crocopeplum]|nr:hypothetical protein F4677DRAFT_451234 [Hypoxylon crocopeplum]